HLLKGRTAIVLKLASFTWYAARNCPEPVIAQWPRSKKGEGEVPAPQNSLAARLVHVFDASAFPRLSTIDTVTRAIGPVPTFTAEQNSTLACPLLSANIMGEFSVPAIAGTPSVRHSAANAITRGVRFIVVVLCRSCSLELLLDVLGRA